MLSQSYSRLIFLGLLVLIPLASWLGWSSREVWGNLLLAGTVFTLWLLDALGGWHEARVRLPLPLVLFTALVALSTLTSSYRYASLLGALQLAAGLAVFDLARRHGRAFGSQRLLNLCLVASGTVVAAAALSQVPTLANLDLGVGSTFAWKNALAGFLALVAPVAVADLATATGKPVRALLAAALGVMAAALFFTVSQAGWIAAAMGVVLALAGVAWVKRSFQASLLVWLGGAALLAVAVVAVLLRVNGGLTQSPAATAATLGRITSQVPASANFRLGYWTTSLKIAAEFPWLGVGLGNFTTWYTHFFREPWQYTVSPHNYLVYLLVTTGAAAAAGFLWFLLQTAAATLRWLRREIAMGATPEPAMLAVTWAAAAAGLLAHSLVDLSLEVPSISLLWWLVAGLLYANLDEGEISPPATTLAATLRLSAATGLIGVTLLTLFADNFYQRGEKFRAAYGRSREAITWLARSRRLMPASANTAEALALTHWDAVLTRSGDRRENIAAALAYAQAAERLDPHSAHRQWVLGTIYTYAHTPQTPYWPQALYHLQQAIAYDFHDPTYYLALAQAYQRLAWHAKALQTIDAGLAIYPPEAIGRIFAGADIYQSFGLRQKLEQLRWLRRYSEPPP